VAARFGVELGALAELSRASRNPAMISSTCVVFAETEIVGLLAEGKPASDIAAGVQAAIASRVSGLAGAMLEQPVYFTGGVALQAGMVGALAEALACPIQVARNPQFTGALGAAILAAHGHASP
jgi:activator of 2-hydroxyglutaryl-CoA dehydratase